MTRLASAEEIVARSSGVVRRPELFDQHLQPLRQGLVCPELFGEQGPPSCACSAPSVGELRRCPTCGELVRDRGPQSERWAHIELPVALAHPFLPGERLEVLPILPPGWRPARVRQDGMINLNLINQHYYDLVMQRIVLRRLVDLRAPEAILSEKVSAMQRRLDAAFGVGARADGEDGRPLPRFPSAIEVKDALTAGARVRPDIEVYAFCMGVVST